MAYDSCILSTSLKNGTVQDLLTANRSIRKMNCERVTLKFSNLGDISSCNIVIYSDASLGNLRDAGSQVGFSIFLEGENKKFRLVYWQSSKVKRVAESTLVAECLADQELEGAGMAFLFLDLFCMIFCNYHLGVTFCQPSVSLIIGLFFILYTLQKHSHTKD